MAKNKKEKETKQKSSYFKDMKAELKKVVWPTPKELLNSTVAVIAFVLIVAVIVFILDLCFDNLNKYGITKFQETVQSAFQETESSEETAEDTDEATENSDDTSEASDEENNDSSEIEETTVYEDAGTEGTSEENISTDESNSENSDAESNE